MCGIAGFFDTSAAMSGETLRFVVQRMSDTLRHRGPDDSGWWIDASCGIGLGHRRLSIQDLSSAGKQPMASQSGRFQLVFNGEIYNFIELHNELKQLGACFRGHSDTEVLLAAIDNWGLEVALSRCAGMFALALWDRDTRTLFLARDRLGEKPLYYGWIGKVFVFASELKALRMFPHWQGEIDPGSVTLFMRYGYIPAPYSIYKGIYKLPPGSFLAINSDSHSHNGFSPEASILCSGRHGPITYWSIKEVAEAGIANPINDAQQAMDELESLLGYVVRQQMVADVPLGAFLSAGIDSVTVASLMQRYSSWPIKTFTVGFQEQGFNEARYAKEIAVHLGTDHTEIYVTPEQVLKSIPLLAVVYDEPFADPSQIPTLLLSKLVRQHVTVCLTGDGGDELFGGYNRYWWSKRMWRLMRRWPNLARRTLGACIRTIPRSLWDSLFEAIGILLPQAAKGPQSTPSDKLLKFADAMDASDFIDLYRRLLSYWKDPVMLARDADEPGTAIAQQNMLTGAVNEVHHMLYWDQLVYLPDDNLVKVDRASMSVALETRIPLLDHRIVEFSWRIPLSMKYREGVGKWLLRQVLYRYVPRKMMERPKMGFSVPVGDWLRGGLRDWAESLLHKKALGTSGFLDTELVQRKWMEHLAGRGNWQAQLWTVLMFQDWYLNHL